MGPQQLGKTPPTLSLVIEWAQTGCYLHPYKSLFFYESITKSPKMHFDSER